MRYAHFAVSKRAAFARAVLQKTINTSSFVVDRVDCVAWPKLNGRFKTNLNYWKTRFRKRTDGSDRAFHKLHGRFIGAVGTTARPGKFYTPYCNIFNFSYRIRAHGYHIYCAPLRALSALCKSISHTPLPPMRTAAVIGTFVGHSGTFIRSSPNDKTVAP